MKKKIKKNNDIITKTPTLEEFYNDERLTEEANDIINNIESFMKLISREKAKEILEFNNSCHKHVYIKGKNGKRKCIYPPVDIKAYSEILSHILFSRFILFIPKEKSLEIEHKIMDKIYAHFYKKPKDFKSDCYFAGGLMNDILKSKVENKKIKSCWLN